MKQIRFDNNRTSSGRNSRILATRQMLHRVVAMLVLAFVCSGAWAQAQVNEGFYYIQWKRTTSYYLSVSGNNYAAGQPYLTSSTTKDFWLLQKNGIYFYIIHASDGKYVVADYNGTGNKEQAVHLEATSSPGDNALFSITQSGAITPKSNSEVSFNVWGGNGGGDIGFYNAGDDGSTWNFVSPTPSSGYVIYSGTEYLGNDAKGTATFNPLTCIWQGSSGGQFTNGTYWLRNNNTFLSSQNNAGTCYLDGTESNTTGRQMRLNNTGTKYYIRYNDNQFQRSNTSSNIVFAVTKTFYPAQTTLPIITGPDRITLTSSTAGTYSRTDAKYQLACDDYVFYNGAHHYCIGDVYKGADRPEESITSYTWSLSDNADGHVIINQSGVASYNTFYDEDTQVVLTLSATTESGKVLTATKTIVFEAPKENPTKVEAVSPMTVYVGKTGKISYTLTPDPCYENVTYESSNTSIVTVAADGTVTGKAVGEATITVKAHSFKSTEFVSTTVTVNVKNQAATPVISFAPNGATATATITCATEGAAIYYTINGDTPDSGSTPYTAPFTVNALDVVKAIAVMNATGWDNSEVASLQYTLGTVPTPTINVRGYEVTFSCDEPGVTYYYTTNGSAPSATNGTRWDGNTITSSANTTIKVIATKSGFAPSEVASKTLGTAHIVYLDFSKGNDANNGLTADKAKQTWAGAYSLLGFGPNAKYLRGQWAAHGLTALSNHTAFNGLTDADFTNTVENNIIYLVGEVSTNNFNGLNQVGENPRSEEDMMKTVIGSGLFKPATISGKYGNLTDASGSKYVRVNLSEGAHTLNEDTRFEYIEFYGAYGGSSTDFRLGYYDLEMGEHITMKHFTSTKDFSTYHHGYAQGVTNTAHILYYGGYARDGRFGNSTDGVLNFDYYLPHPEGYRITFRSGYFSTISPGSTQWSQGTINGAMGSPNTPVKCTILVDIDRKWNDDHADGVLGNTSNGKPDCDLAVLMAGTHEGNIYGDVDIIVKSGRIDRIVNGTFGANYFVANHPADSYFGRANILIDPREPSTAENTAYPTKYTDKNSMVTVRELYGGGLGRFKSDSDKNNQSSTYFYGKSTVTINGGTFLSAIYASGAGGVNGVGDATHHTPDEMLPYMDNGSIKYGDYAAYSSHDKLVVKFHKARNVYEPDFHTDDATIESSLTIDQTSAKVEIHGGVFGSASSPIEGIFGGGYGFVDSELINYTGNNGAKPNTRAGAIFAAAGQTASSVTIDGDTEIYGNVYGAGRGSDTYNKANISFSGDTYTQLGQVAGNVELTIGGDAKIHGSVYGAGLGINGLTDMARLYGNTTLTVKENAVITGGVYGGGENGIVDQNGSSYGNTIVNVIGGTIGSATTPSNVHGGGKGSQTRVMGSVNLTVGEANATTGATIYGDVYGGSAEGKTNGNDSRTTNAVTNVTLNAGTINGSLYGGGLGTSGTNGNAADVYGPVQVTVNGGSVVKNTSISGSGNVFGCNNVNGTPKREVTVTINGTDQPESGYALNGVYGGGNLSDYVPGTGLTAASNGIDEYPQVYVKGCDNSIKDLYGGGNAASVPDTYVEVEGGTIDRVFAGGNGESGTPAHVGFRADGTTTYGTGTATANIMGGTINQVFGGSNANGNIRGAVTINVDKDSDCEMHIDEVYGGGNEADGKAGTINIGCTGAEGEGIGTVYGGANNAAIGTSTNKSNITLNITGGSIDNVFGGNNNGGIINGTITVNVDWATGTSACGYNYLGNVYGAGNMAAYTGNPVVNVKNGTVTGNVFGGGLSAEVTGNTKVEVTGGEVETAVYGGGALANVTGNTTVNLFGGTVNDVYGGGLGRNASGTEGQTGYLPAVAALVGGNTNVTLGGTVGGKLVGSVVNGSIFGCNNINGTPQGHAKVTILKTTSRAGQEDDEYDVVAVYGGGNNAAYVPNTPTSKIAEDDAKAYAYSEVDVKGCDNSIKFVYGGGNAASTPATKVTIEGGTIFNVFGGGNGKTEAGATTPNPGADIGYKNWTYDTANEYGEGTTNVNIYGGTITSVFGGSNTKGNIRVASNVVLDDRTEESGCTFLVGDVYGAGNEAEMYGNGNLTIGCIPGLDEIYGGAKNANINGDVSITITNGEFGKVFGGNNLGGDIKGSITVNIEETGCRPIVIGELYGGGNLAAYTAPTATSYGVNAGKFPMVNVKSFTSIGTVFGAGLGMTDAKIDALSTDDLKEAAKALGKTDAEIEVLSETELKALTKPYFKAKGVVHGSPQVNIGLIEGKFANGGSHGSETFPAISNKWNNKLGTIGTVYGGGNAANVEGDTYVNIGTVSTISLVSGDDHSDKAVQGVNISGNVYGGGNAADVTGKTNVQIGQAGTTSSGE